MQKNMQDPKSSAWYSTVCWQLDPRAHITKSIKTVYFI